MKETGTSSKILQGAFVLSIAMVLSKLIGTLQKIPLQNMGGDVVFGIYNTVYPFYTVMITVALAGFPAAISKFVAEDAALGGQSQSGRVIRIASLVMALSGILFGAVIYFGAPLIGMIIDNASVVPALKASAVALLFVPLMSGLRGFFQGYQNMMPTAVSQITEQCVRVAVMIILLVYLTTVGASAEHIAAGALFGSAAGGAAGLVVMGGYWRRYRRGRHPAIRGNASVGEAREIGQESRSLLWSMLKYAIPICLGALAISLVNLADTFTVPRLLKASGAGEDGAMIQFGIYNRGMPVVQLITMLATSLSVLFIPALAEAKVTGDKQLVADRCRLSLRWFWLVGMAASIGIAVLAMPLNIALYQDGTGTSVIRWIAFTSAGSALSIISAALLQGIGIVKAPALHLLAAAAVKTLLNLLLVPQLGITGAAIASVAAHFLAAALNIALLSRRTGLRISAGAMLAKPAVIFAGMAPAACAAMLAADALLSVLGLHARISAAAASLAGAAAGGAIFLAGAAKTGLLSEQELRMLPKIGAPLSRLLSRLHLLA
ncbi:putative polysaccharide biosynthesis protein [Paenibacillus dokdonensis]|uniref:putative polysaccharide biosynthesis protein n=1 Tax=Paenibacillus dokdonensis TaxID=2567944 RepID=UPI0010A89D50|nr:polysaccharide biosynthesis protein [Paenibacillus dokdonensis]